MKRGMVIVIIFLAVVVVPSLFVASQPSNVDLSVEMFPLSREIKQGETIIVYSRVDTHEDEFIDVIISYRIRDNKGLTVFESLETVAVEKTARIIENLRVPRSLDPDTYFVDVEFRYKDIVKLERRTFEVVGEPVKISFDKGLMLIVIVVLFIFFILLLIQHRKINHILESQEYDAEHIV